MDTHVASLTLLGHLYMFFTAPVAISAPGYFTGGMNWIFS